MIMKNKKTLALVAHNNKKIDMVQFCVEHYKKLKNFDLYATDGTANAIRKVCPTLKIKRAKIDERFSQSYNDWYSSENDVIWE